MNILVKYTFWPNSVPGLKESIELMAHNYKEAHDRALKYVYLNKTGLHLVRGVRIDSYGNEVSYLEN